LYKKANVDEKRQLLGLVFNKMVLQGKNLSVELVKPFALLEQAVVATNAYNTQSGENGEKEFSNLIDKTKKRPFEATSLIWRTERDSNPRPLP
jgi:hypothetical protein